MCCPPKERKGPQNNVWIWKYPLSEHQYIVSADISRGDSKDFSTFHIVDIGEGEVVAEYKGKIPPDRFAETLNEFGRMYNDALMCPENNGYGYATILKLKDLDYPNLYYKKRKAIYVGNYVPQKESDIPGFTTSGKSRNLILTKLEEILRNKLIKVYSTRLYDELKVFIWSGTKAKAMKGYNDDLVISIAIAMWLYDASGDYSRNSKELNSAMLAAMNFERKPYDDIPEAISSNRPFGSKMTNPKTDNRSQSSSKRLASGWNSRLNLNGEFDWVLK